MAPLLGPADSFNSSAATIRADAKERVFPSVAGGRDLGPQDSVGRELDALLSGQVGVLQADPAADQRAMADNDMVARYLNQQYARMPHDPPSPVDPNFNPLSFLEEIGMSGDTPAGATIDPTAFAPAFDSPAPATFRPSSAHSHRSHLSLSSTDVDDSGFYTTDMDTDDNESVHSARYYDNNLTSPSPVADIGALNLGAGAGAWGGFGNAAAGPSANATIAPDAEGLGSARTTRRSVRGVQSADDEEKKRLDRLEHRRSINRRSAQKHRLRRKEELETLTVQIAERDTRIATLEKELAVTKAQLTQLASFVKGTFKMKERGPEDSQ